MACKLTDRRLEPCEDYPLKFFLLEINDELTDEDLRRLKFLCQGKYGIEKAKMEQITSPLDLFDTLREKELLNEINIITLQALLWVLPRRDLQKKYVEFAESLGSSIHFVVPKESPENGYKYLKFHIRGADLNNYKRGELEMLRSKIGFLLRVPPEFVIVSGIEPSSSLMITIMLLEDDAIRLVSSSTESLAILSDMFVSYIMIGEKSIPVSGPSEGEKMADDEGTDVDITHDVFLIHANEPSEDKEFALKKLKPLLKEQGLKVLTDDEEFQGGQVVLDNIARAVRRCRKSVIVLTKDSNESPWCSLELLLALEKSHRHNAMSLVVLRKGHSVEERLALDMLNTVPHVDIENYEDIDNKLEDLVTKIKERRQTEELLPAGNIAHAQVWSHYFGLLQYLLPEIENLIKKTELYKKYPNRFSLKLYELIPENCRCPRIVQDIPNCEDNSNNTKRISVLEDKLPTLEYTRSGNKREVSMSIYSVKDKDGQEYYCVAEYPAVIAGIQKMIEDTSTRLRDCDRRIQLGRFYYTLTALLRHESLPDSLNKANVILYNENRPGFVLADEMVKTIKQDLHVEGINEGRVEKPLDRLSSREPDSYQYEAFLFYDDQDDSSREKGAEIAQYLEMKGLKFYLEVERSGRRKFDLDLAIQECYWTIVILTRKSLLNKEFTMKVLSLLEFFLGEKKIRLIPVLVDTRYGDIPDAIRFVTYVGVDDSKKYLERLYCTLQGKDIPFDKDSLIPAGDVGYALAWTYALNYLQFVLKGLGDSITKTLEQHSKSSCMHRKKIYIIVPFSCDCKDTLSKADDKISKLDTIHPVYKDFSGNERKYTFDMYTFKDSEQEYAFAGQYAAPVTCLNEMMKVKIAGVKEADMVKQSRIFCREIEKILDEKFAEVKDSCEIVSYDDRIHQLSTEMKRRLSTGN